MTGPRLRTRSRHAHGPGAGCASCRECPSCDGGTSPTPEQYRVERPTPTAAVVVCSRCHDGSGVVCPNYVEESR